MKTDLDEDCKTLRSLFKDIEKVFGNVSKKERQNLLLRLLAFVDKSENANCSSDTGAFNGFLAETTRVRSGISRKKLGLCIKMHEMTIFKMEKGGLPFNPDKPKHRAYMVWLIEHGYPKPPVE